MVVERRRRIVAARMKRVTAGEPPRAEQDAASQAESFDASGGVAGATGLESAPRTQEGRQRLLIDPDDTEDNGPTGKAWIKPRTSACQDGVRADLRRPDCWRTCQS